MQTSIREFLVLRFDVVDLQRDRARSDDLAGGALCEKERKISVVLEADGAALGDVDRDLEAEVLGLPLARSGAVAHRDRKLIEANH